MPGLSNTQTVPLLRRRFDGKQCGVQVRSVPPRPSARLDMCIALGSSPPSARLVVQSDDEAVARFLEFPR
jgi:hypothetical protein